MIGRCLSPARFPSNFENFRCDFDKARLIVARLGRPKAGFPPAQPQQVCPYGFHPQALPTAGLPVGQPSPSSTSGRGVGAQ